MILPLYKWGKCVFAYHLNFLIPKSLVSCCCCSVSKSCPTLLDPLDSSTLGFPVLHDLPEFAQTHVRWVGDAIQPSHPLLSPSPAFSLSQRQGPFQWISSSHHVAKVLWSFSFSICPSNQYSLLISFRMDWLDLLAIQGTLKRLLQHHSSKASILQRSAFFMVHLSPPSRSSGKRMANVNQGKHTSKK